MTVRIQVTQGGLALPISDDGVGFDDEETFAGHLGLKSLRERAGNLGGELHLASAPVRGWPPVP